MPRTLILIGLILIAIGLLWPWLGWLRLGRLPGDIIIHRPHITVYFPVTTAILISVVVSLILWIVNR